MSEPNIVKNLTRKAPYAAIPNTLAQDKRLSFKARGLLLLMLSMPDDWETRVGWFEAETPHEGREAIRSAIKELVEMGYCRKTENRDNGGEFDGFTWQWTYEPGNFTEDGKPSADGERQPVAGKPLTATRPLQRKQEQTQQEERIQEPAASPGLDSDPSSKPFLPTTIASTWNDICVSLPKVAEITSKRFKSINARCGGSIETLEDVCRMIEASDFLTGRLSGSAPNWMNFDWITNATNYTKVIEGRYVNKGRVDRKTTQDDRF